MNLNNPAPVHYSLTARLGLYAADGTFGGYFPPINFKEFTIDPNGKLVTQSDNSVEYFGEIRNAHVVNEGTKITGKLDEINRDLFAAYLNAVTSTFTQAAATAQTVTKTLTLNRGTFIGTRNIGNLAITGKARYTDFDYDGESGIVTALTSGCAGSKEMTFDVGAIDGSKIVSGRTTPVYLALDGKTRDLQSGETGRIVVGKFCIDAKTALMLVGGKDYHEFDFDGYGMVPGSNSPNYKSGIVEPVYTLIPDQALTAVA